MNKCYINLGCFYLLNYVHLELKYRSDYSIYSKTDKLSSITEFIQNKGGDCEDYSLFFKAEYNYAMNKCKGNEIHLEAWKYPDIDYSSLNDKAEMIWLNYPKTWYLDGVVKVDISKNIFPNIICGSLFDATVNTTMGHCMLAFTSNKIETISDFKYLEDAYIIEPQLGLYLGNLNNENSGVYLLDEYVLYTDSITSWVDSVITDNDYFLFNRENLTWQSYGAFYTVLNLKKNQIGNILK